MYMPNTIVVIIVPIVATTIRITAVGDIVHIILTIAIMVLMVIKLQLQQRHSLTSLHKR